VPIYKFINLKTHQLTNLKTQELINQKLKFCPEMPKVLKEKGENHKKYT